VCVLQSWENLRSAWIPEGGDWHRAGADHLALAPKFRNRRLLWPIRVRRAAKTDGRPLRRQNISMNAPTKMMKEQGYGGSLRLSIHDAETAVLGAELFS